nr:hypothetical protein [Brevundimonas abyssalis]
MGLAGLEEQHRPFGGHLPGHGVAHGRMADGLVRGEQDLGGGAHGAVDAVDGAGRIGRLADAAVAGRGVPAQVGRSQTGAGQDGVAEGGWRQAGRSRAGIGQGGGGQAGQGGRAQERQERSHGITSGSER